MGMPPSTRLLAQNFGWETRRPGNRCNPSSGARPGVWFRRACGRRVFDFDVSRRHSVGVSPVGVPRAFWSCGVTSLALCEEAVFATQMYDLAPTSLVDGTGSSTQAYADDLLPVSTPQPPVPESGHQRAALVGGLWCCRRSSTSCRVSISSLSALSLGAHDQVLSRLRHKPFRLP